MECDSLHVYIHIAHVGYNNATTQKKFRFSINTIFRLATFQALQRDKAKYKSFTMVTFLQISVGFHQQFYFFVFCSSYRMSIFEL